MAKCYNRNDAGYTALRNVYSSDVETSQVVSNWQKLWLKIKMFFFH